MSVSPSDCLARLCRFHGLDAAAEVLETAYNQRATLSIPIDLLEHEDEVVADILDAIKDGVDVIVITGR